MTDINIGLHIRQATVIDELSHLGNAIEKTQPERFKLQSNLHTSLASILTDLPHSFYTPFPLCFGWNHFSLPDILSKHQQKVIRIEGLSEIYESIGPLHMVISNRIIKVNQSSRNDHGGHNGQIIIVACPSYKINLCLLNSHRFSKNIH